MAHARETLVRMGSLLLFHCRGWQCYCRRTGGSAGVGGSENLSM